MLLHYITCCSVYLHKYEPWFSKKKNVKFVLHFILRFFWKMMQNSTIAEHEMNFEFYSQSCVVPHFLFCHKLTFFNALWDFSHYKDELNRNEGGNSSLEWIHFFRQVTFNMSRKMRREERERERDRVFAFESENG